MILLLKPISQYSNRRQDCHQGHQQSPLLPSAPIVPIAPIIPRAPRATAIAAAGIVAIEVSQPMLVAPFADGNGWE